LRFDDTNPTTEDTEYVESIQEDIRWLGFVWKGEPLYASDYFGAGGGHYIVALFQTIPLHENGNLLLTVDRSTSTQTDKFMRDNDGTYHHWRIAYLASWQGLNWTLAFDDTDYSLPFYGDAKISIAVAKTFSW